MIIRYHLAFFFIYVQFYSYFSISAIPHLSLFSSFKMVDNKYSILIYWIFKFSHLVIILETCYCWQILYHLFLILLYEVYNSISWLVTLYSVFGFIIFKFCSYSTHGIQVLFLFKAKAVTYVTFWAFSEIMYFCIFYNQINNTTSFFYFICVVGKLPFNKIKKSQKHVFLFFICFMCM